MVRPDDYENIVKWLEKYHPEPFQLQNSKERLRLYSLEYDLDLLKSYPDEQALVERITANIGL